jgi:hypothetical protein
MIGRWSCRQHDRKGILLTIRGLGHGNLLTQTSWLWLISLFWVSGRCIGQTYDGFGYSVSGTNITIAGYTGPGGAVTIPSSIPGVNGTVTAIGDGAFSLCRGLTRVTIPNSVASIGDEAFSACSGLSSVIIPKSVTYIGGSAFEGCSGLTSVTIPSSYIGELAFAFCPGLTSVTISSSVTSIGDWAFAACTGLTSAYFRGDAPSIFFGVEVFQATAPGFAIYYPRTATGWY